MRVFSATWQEANSSPSILVDDIPVRRVSLDIRSSSSVRLAAYNRALAKYCLASKPDVLQLFSLNPRSLPSLLSIRRARIPTVFTQTMVRDPSVGRLKNIYWRTPFRLIDVTVVSSGVMREGLRDVGYAGRVDVIPNGVDIQRFRPLASVAEKEALRAKLHLPAEAELVIFVGGFITHRKGIDVLLQAWSRVSRDREGARLVIVGPHINKLGKVEREREFVRKVFAQLETSRVKDTVLFTGEVEAVEHYLQVADVFVFPSRREGMPNVVPEAFACGLPCILAPFVGLPDEFGRPDKEYVLADRTAEAFAAAINRMLDEPDRRKLFGARAREWVERELGQEASLDKYAALYRELAKRQLEGG